MTRLEEIKNKYGGTFLLHIKKDSPGEDIIWLIEKLDKAIEMAEFYYEQYKDGQINDGSKAYEFLEGLEKDNKEDSVFNAPLNLNIKKVTKVCD